MAKNIQNIVKTVSSQFVRKTKYASQCVAQTNLSPQQLQILNDSTPTQASTIGKKTQEKIKQLFSRFSTETRTIKFKDNEHTFTVFKGSRSGFNPGYWALEESTGRLGYVKFGNEAHMRSEHIASELYKLTGAKTPAISIIKERGDIGIISRYLPSEEATLAHAKALREDFAADCWLANWDALKSGNAVMVNGQPVRLDVGGSLCYRAQGGNKGAAFGEEVKELSSFFGAKSQSLPYLKDMTRDELLFSLNKVANVSDDDVIELVNKHGYEMSYGPYWDSATHTHDFRMRSKAVIHNAEYLKETLIARKHYITQFMQKCKATPQKEGETIAEYIKRVEEAIPKQTRYTIPFEKLSLSCRVGTEVKGRNLAEALTPSQKRLYEISKKAFEESAPKKIAHPNTTDILTEDTMLHGTSIKGFAAILEEGFTPSEFRAMSESGTGDETLTTLCADFWDVQGKFSIKDYFSKNRKWNKGETNFLPNPFNNDGYGIVLSVDKSSVDKTLMKHSFLAPDYLTTTFGKDYMVMPHLEYASHRAVPIGVPANAIDRVILRADLFSDEDIEGIIKIIKHSGRDIKLYDTNGKLIWQPLKAIDILRRYKFHLYGKSGIPLKYSREQFRNDVWTLIAKEVPENERTAFLARFNLTAGVNGVLDGIPVIKNFVPKTKAEEKMLNIIKRFYENETVIDGNTQAKKLLDGILRKHPEFAMMIGKMQHATHNFSVDIHSLEVLQKSLNNPRYNALSKEGQDILKHVAIMHDYGKMGHVITKGHAVDSTKFAKDVLETFEDMPEDTKKRILNLIENHHWFEGYNTGRLSAKEFAELFPNPEDREIAIILARGDFESVGGGFHLRRLNPAKVLSDEEYETEIESIMNNLLSKI